MPIFTDQEVCMRRLLAFTALSLLMLQAPLRAQEGGDDSAEENFSEEAGVADELNSPADESERFYPQERFNQWVCRARPLYGFGSYTGSSLYFQPGSGEGQRAHRQAYRRALRQCERQSPGPRGCYSDFNRDCWVIRI